MNKNDSEKIAALLEHCDYTETSNEQAADLIIINTCSVRDKAERRVWGKLGDLKNRRKTDKNFLIGICGCMPQYKKEELLQDAPHLNLVFGTNTIHRLPEMLHRVGPDRCIFDLASDMDETEIAIIPKRQSEHQAWIPISFGCNNFCTYCIVPHTRGREKSRKKEDILNEIQQLNKQDYTKIVLLGQNVNSYGQDIYQTYDFADLLKDVSQLQGLTLIDFMTSHPKDVSDKLILTVKNTPLINKAFHVPIQAGDDEILKRMNRHYSVKDYRLLIEKIRAEIPTAKISTDIIVGFPGETQEQFQNTLNVVREIKFNQVNTAAYSARTLTAAAALPEQIPARERAHRLHTLMAVVDETLRDSR